VVAAFPGATLAEKANAYKDWLTNRLIERVQMVESRRIDEAANAQKVIQLAALAQSLPPMAVEPEIPESEPAP
jgi:hypothetical protein